ncbi:MAG: hypothetical protein IKP36_11840 [Bacteroidaceae bacterium]|nr:hypothetical protein [Bacteroidaceae bacterium]
MKNLSKRWHNLVTMWLKALTLSDVLLRGGEVSLISKQQAIIEIPYNSSSYAGFYFWLNFVTFCRFSDFYRKFAPNRSRDLKVDTNGSSVVKVLIESYKE